MKCTLYIAKGKNMFTISPANVRASIAFQVSYPQEGSTATHPFVFMQDASHKGTLLNAQDISDTLEFYQVLNGAVMAIESNYIAEHEIESFMISQFGTHKVVRR